MTYDQSPLRTGPGSLPGGYLLFTNQPELDRYQKACPPVGLISISLYRQWRFASRQTGPHCRRNTYTFKEEILKYLVALLLCLTRASVVHMDNVKYFMVLMSSLTSVCVAPMSPASIIRQLSLYCLVDEVLRRGEIVNISLTSSWQSERMDGRADGRWQIQ